MQVCIGSVWYISEGIDPCFLLAGGLWKLYTNTGKKWKIQRQPLFVQYKPKANPLLSMQNFTPHVIKQRILLKGLSYEMGLAF
jgi:hypothetical protein